MDNGALFISTTLADSAEEHAVDLKFIQPEKPTQTSFIERFNRTYRDDVKNISVLKPCAKYALLPDIGRTNTSNNAPMTPRGVSRHSNIEWLISSENYST